MTYITETMIYGSMKYQMNRSQTKWMQDTVRTQTGKRIANAEDDPNGAAKALILKDGILQMEGMEKVAAVAGARIDDSLNAMEKMLEVLQGALNNDIRSGNGTYNPQDRQRVSVAMTGARDAFLQAANATSNGRYLFGGNMDDAAPFQTDGTYLGDDGIVNLQVAPNLWIQSNMPGSSVIDVQGGQNVIKVLNNLITALQADDRQGIQDGLSHLHACKDQLSVAVADVGGPQASLIYAKGLRQSLKQSLEEQRVSVEEVDITSSASDMMQSSIAMQAAMAVTQQVIQALNASIR